MRPRLLFVLVVYPPELTRFHRLFGGKECRDVRPELVVPPCIIKVAGLPFALQHFPYVVSDLQEQRPPCLLERFVLSSSTQLLQLALHRPELFHDFVNGCAAIGKTVRLEHSNILI